MHVLSIAYMPRVKLPTLKLLQWNYLRPTVSHILHMHVRLCHSLKDINKLDNLIARALYRIFKVHDRENINYLHQCLNITSLHVTVELRKQRFTDKLIGLEHFRPILS